MDDNYHYMDESERNTQGSYDLAEEALEACRRIVDTFLKSMASANPLIPSIHAVKMCLKPRLLSWVTTSRQNLVRSAQTALERSRHLRYHMYVEQKCPTRREQEIKMAEDISNETTDMTPPSKTSEWLEKVDNSTVGDLRKQYPKAFWIVGGVILIALLF